MGFLVTLPNWRLTRPLLVTNLLYLLEPYPAKWKQFDLIVLVARRRIKKDPLQGWVFRWISLLSYGNEYPAPSVK